MRKTAYLILLLVVLTGLACNRKVLVIEASMEGCVIPENNYLYDSLLAVTVHNLHFDTSNCEKNLKKRFSPRSISLAEDLNVESFLCELYRLEQQKPQDENALHRIKTELLQRFTAGLTDLNSLQAEITCERERIQEVYDYLSAWINKRVSRATVFSILAGGLTTAVAGIIAARQLEEIPIIEQTTSITGAVVGSYLSLRSLAIRHKIKFLHDRNHLVDIWYKTSQSRIYSPYIWNFLSKPYLLKGQTITGCDEILKKWKRLGLPEEEGSKHYQKKLNLALGIGGDYHLEDLENRLKMYEILTDEIITINYHLNRLQEEIILGFKP